MNTVDGQVGRGCSWGYVARKRLVNERWMGNSLRKKVGPRERATR